MKTQIKFDIDGVCRNLGIIHKRFNIPKLTNNWHWKYKGKDVYDWVAEDLSILESAPSLEYIEAIKEFGKNHKIEFWTHQPKDWEPHTRRWIKKFFGDKCKIVFLKPNEKFNRLKKNKNTLLVDDYPLFKDYKQIILVNQYYNQDTKAPIRVKNNKELSKELKKYN